MDTPGSAEGVAASGIYAYVADLDSGLRILPAQCEPQASAGDHEGPAASIVPLALPNPSSHQTTIRFGIRQGGLVRVAVFDPAGRRVRLLSDRLLGPGVHDLLWDGRDDAGRDVTAGVYRARISTAEGTTSTGVVILRQRRRGRIVVPRGSGSIPLDQGSRTIFTVDGSS